MRRSRSEENMKKLLLVLLVGLLLVGCTTYRVYNVYNIADNGSTITQKIEVLAEVPKTTSVNTDVSGTLP